MKYFSLLFASVIFLNLSCTKTSSLNSFNVDAKVVSQLTNQPISNARLYVKVVSKQGSGLLSYETLIDSFSVISDNNGKISCNIKYNNEPNIVVKFYKQDDSYSTGLFPQKTEYSISDLKNATTLTFYVRNYAYLKINLKSVNPIDSNDAVSLYIFQDSTNYQNNIIDSVINFGVKNQPLSYPAADNGTNPYWVGKIVNSIIYGKIQEGTIYQITWNVRRNGVNTDNKSPRIQTSMNSMNVYDINY